MLGDFAGLQPPNPQRGARHGWGRQVARADADAVVHSPADGLGVGKSHEV